MKRTVMTIRLPTMEQIIVAGVSSMSPEEQKAWMNEHSIKLYEEREHPRRSTEGPYDIARRYTPPASK